MGLKMSITRMSSLLFVHTEHVYIVEVVTVFRLLYEVFSIVRGLLLRMLPFFRLWRWLPWCFLIT